MADQDAPQEADISSEDIIFECPHCGKSLAIDPVGAGMVIVCPDCQAKVQIPGGPADLDRAAGVDRVLADNIDYYEEIGKELGLIQSAMDRIVGILQDATTENISSRHR